MFRRFPTQKSKMSQEGGEEEGNEVHLGLPCGRQKVEAKKLNVSRRRRRRTKWYLLAIPCGRQKVALRPLWNQRIWPNSSIAVNILWP